MHHQDNDFVLPVEVISPQNLELVVRDDDSRALAWTMAREAWLESKRRRSGRNNTVNAYSTALDQFLAWSPVPLWEVSAAVAQAWAVALERGETLRYFGPVVANSRSGKIHHPNCRAAPTEAYREELLDLRAGQEAGYTLCGLCARDLGHGRALAPASVNQKLAALSSFYAFVKTRFTFRLPGGQELALWPADRENPFLAVERAQVDTYGRAEYPTYEEVVAMLATCNLESARGMRDYALVYTLVVTCRRSSEILNLTWGDIEPAADGNYKFRYVYKGGKEKWAPLRREVYQVLVDYLKMVGRWIPDDGDYLFTPLEPKRARRVGAPVDPNTPITNTHLNAILKKLGRRAGVDAVKCHVHGLRHAGARKRYQEAKKEGNVDLLELSQFLGHSNVSTTQVYTMQVLDDPEDPAGASAAAAFRPPPKKRRGKKNQVAEQQELFET